MSGHSTEVIHCPNCKEDVPRTLYCLNCGYPLYKLEQTKTDESIEKKSSKIPEEEVNMSVEIEPQETSPEPEPIEEEIEEEKFVPKNETEPEIETTITVEEETESDTEPEPIEEEQPNISEQEEVYEELAEEDESDPEPFIEPEVETDIITPEERELYMMDEIKIEFAPDPLTKEVMESLAKNITLKVRLVRLLRENQVKEETFKKLFDSYVEQGRLWVERRNEIIRHFKADIARMEQELISVRKDFELLEIRKNIGDANTEEYSVKAPAYKWDIENLDKEINNTRGSIQYVLNLKGLIPDVEVEELRQMSESDSSELDEIDGVSSDTLARTKEALSEALNILEA